MDIKHLYADIYRVNLSEKEIDEIEKYVDLDAFGVELFEGENTLTRETLNDILVPLNHLQYFSKTGYHIMQVLTGTLSETPETPTKEQIERGDDLDELTMQFIRDFKRIAMSGETLDLDEHQLLDTAKSVIEAVTPIIEGVTGAKIETINNNY